MHDVGQKTLEALTQMFPERAVKARERATGNILAVSFLHEDRRLLMETPHESDYRQQAPSWWIHRCAALIREKTT